MFQSTALNEITVFPLGFIIYFDPKDTITYEDIDITSLSDFDYDEIVYINCGVYIYLENGMSVVAELPFGAFSISEDGTVTYYTSYASDETDWATVFEECSNEGSDHGYSGYINFSEE